VTFWRSTPFAPNRAGRFRASSSCHVLDDAESQPMPGSSRYPWPAVKKALVAGVLLWERSHNRGPDERWFGVLGVLAVQCAYPASAATRSARSSEAVRPGDSMPIRW
jgi:hypothetical protein